MVQKDFCNNFPIEIEEKMEKMRTFRCDNKTWRNFKLICTMDNVSMQTQLGRLVGDFVKSKSLNTDVLANGKRIKSHTNI